MRHRNPNVQTWIYELGWRIARHTETLPRDLSWFRGLWP